MRRYLWSWNWLRLGRSIRGMSIDKESNGLPQVDFQRRTTKVNVWMVIGVAAFFVIAVLLVLHYAR